ncbi:uncharacterized protein NECHADRAFT_77429 [Fusarium vanettenii 77-13-4]|uniref:Uncharacterized protein n=1 Tax=Fusarium vanettenii (strain ATCC MYA-4622 / CBS 123669 / FGSC 9596 / NRRL 45880 / 77-13-4) TaxID=660122 RepID=C7YL73_FUSV7|nr:uncharacterized protein NECHADRAFT_77429 [Fusarium vanettenii 77-13-4]EEU46737.1 predicted protein [Fusarium vanettenii 77-13-4]
MEQQGPPAYRCEGHTDTQTHTGHCLLVPLGVLPLLQQPAASQPTADTCAHYGSPAQAGWRFDTFSSPTLLETKRRRPLPGCAPTMDAPSRGLVGDGPLTKSQAALQGGQGLLDQLKVVARACSSPAPIPDTDVDVKRAKAEGIHGRKLAAQ